MSWLYILLGLVVVWCEERPYILARLGLEFQIHRRSFPKQILAPVLRFAYLGARRLHEKVHSVPPQTQFDKLALATWRNGSLLIDDSVKWLNKRRTMHPTWDHDHDRLVAAYRKVFPETLDSGRKLGKGGCDWVALGFQGADPCLDFRAAGMLGLDHYTGFCQNYTADARRLVVESGSLKSTDSPKWYSLALASIYLSNSLAKLLVSEPLFIACISGETMAFQQLFGTFHNRILIAFHQHWVSETHDGTVKSVMDTDDSLRRFEAKLPTILWGMRS